MGIYTDFLANTTTLDIESPRVGTDKAAYRGIQALQNVQGDRDYPAGFDAAAGDAQEQTIAVYDGTVDGGTFNMAHQLADEQTWETAEIAFDADAATIQAAIDLAAGATVTGYTAGDIAVTGGPLTTDPVVLTFSGDSVVGQTHLLVAVDGDNLTGGGTVENATETGAATEGQSKRTAWAILFACGAISGTLPTQGEAPTAITAGSTRSANPYLPDQGTLRVLAHAAAVEDGNADVETEILRVLGLS